MHISYICVWTLLTKFNSLYSHNRLPVTHDLCLHCRVQSVSQHADVVVQFKNVHIYICQL